MRLRRRRSNRKLNVESREQRQLMTGDVTGDGLVDVADVDAVFGGANQGSQDEQLDLDMDGVVTSADGIFLVEDILRTKPGDVDFDGKVIFADFLALSANFGRPAQSWSDGDLDGDGTVGFPDFLQLSKNFGFIRNETADDVTFSILSPTEEIDLPRPSLSGVLWKGLRLIPSRSIR